uniref:Uncharacterized protein n=1 Tax=Anguilla anguilla TaxID=7936 RepID=A0A0E9T5K5_ANGAN
MCSVLETLQFKHIEQYRLSVQFIVKIKHHSS